MFQGFILCGVLLYSTCSGAKRVNGLFLKFPPCGCFLKGDGSQGYGDTGGEAANALADLISDQGLSDSSGCVHENHNRHRFHESLFSLSPTGLVCLVLCLCRPESEIVQKSGAQKRIRSNDGIDLVLERNRVCFFLFAANACLSFGRGRSPGFVPRGSSPCDELDEVRLRHGDGSLPLTNCGACGEDAPGPCRISWVSDWGTFSERLAPEILYCFFEHFWRGSASCSQRVESPSWFDSNRTSVLYITCKNRIG